MEGSARHAPSGRDRLLRRTRLLTGVLAVTTAGATAVLSAVAAHAFKGHDGKHTATATRTTVAKRPARVTVPPPQAIPSISGAPQPLQPPAQAPSQTPSQAPAQAPAPAPPPPQPVPVPQTSGGS